MMENKETFEYLGREFQYRLIKLIISDKKFGKNILDILSPNYFEDEYLRKIVSTIHEVNEDSNCIPDADTIKIRINKSVSNEYKQKIFASTIDKILEANIEDHTFIEEESFNFCRQQELKKADMEANEIISKGRTDKYDQIIDIFQRALEAGKDREDASDIFDNIDEVLDDDYRDPIPTGIEKLDQEMNGGLARTELGVLLAALGVGKTSALTKFANVAKDNGNNVLHIFFEDQTKSIQRKHLSAWTHIDLNNLKDHEDVVKKTIEQKKKEGGILKLKKFNSSGVTIPKIKQYIRKLISQGFHPDMVVLDYIDCVNSDKNYKSEDIHQSEGDVMREFESMLSELNMAGWTAVQGNRSSIGADIVEASQIGGSIKKAQVGHFILSLAKSLEQKELGKANASILKSRIGRDGLTFNDITFENSKMNIHIPPDAESRTFLDEKKLTEKKGQEKVNEVVGKNNN